MLRDDQHGFLLINKPSGCTSFDCVSKIRKLVGKKVKVGHTGTLDDFATGLLIICVGRKATRFSGSIMNVDKEYVVKAKLGELTDTLDYTGTVIETSDASHITDNDIRQAIESLGNEYEQVPPIYSALKHEGKPLHRLARNQQLSTEALTNIVKHKKRTVKLHALKLIAFDHPFMTLQARVSKGTYIRSLANDIAQQVNAHATTYQLERTSIGDISLEQACDLDLFTSQEMVLDQLIPLDAIMGMLGLQ